MVNALGWTLGKTLVKALVKSWLGDGVVNDIFGDVLNFSTDQIKERQTSSPTRIMVTRVAQNLKPLFESEGSGLSEEDRKRVVRAIGQTVADLKADTLVEYNLDQQNLFNHLTQSSDMIRDFSEAETSFYRRMLNEVCKSLVKLAPKLPDFQYAWAASTLQEQDSIRNLVDKLMRYPDENDNAFEERYRSLIAKELDKVDFLGIGKVDNIARRQSLSIAYVNLKVESISGLCDFSTAKQRTSIPDGQNRQPWSGTVDQVLTEGSRFLVFGEAGTGKTTLLHWLAVRAAKQDFEATLKLLNNSVPFVIHLRDYANTEAGFPTPENFPREVASMIVGGMPDGWVHRQLEKGRGLVLIDGVDEIPQSLREKMLENLKQLVRMYPFCRYIITSRPAALKSQDWSEWNRWISEQRFREVSFQSMNSSQIKSFVRQWHTALWWASMESKKSADELAAGLLRILDRRSDLQRLAESPLLCAMLCALHYDRRESLPSERRQLYSDCIDILIERRDVKREVELGLPINIGAKRRLIRYLAYWMLDNQLPRVAKEETDRRLSEKLHSLTRRKDISGQNVRCFFVQRANLLREPVLGQIEFVHRSFQEYLAAQHAVLHERNFGALVKNALDDQWQEVIILAIGEITSVKERDTFLEKLLELANSLDSTHMRNHIILIAAAGLAQSVELPPGNIHQIISKGLEKVIPPEPDEMELLAAAGEMAIDFLKYDSNHDEIESLRCIEVLFQIGSQDALQALQSYAKDERAMVRTALGNARDSFNQSDYIQEILSQSDTLIMTQPLDSLESLKYLTHLKDLRLCLGKSINDMSPLSACHRLTRLGIAGDGCIDLKPVGDLKNLTDLSIGTWMVPNQLVVYDRFVANLSPLTELKKLTNLTVWGGQIESFETLSSMRTLTSLKLGGDNLHNIRPLSTLSKLEELYVGIIPLHEWQEGYWMWSKNLTPVSDIKPLVTLSNLRKLVLGYVTATHLEPLRELSELSSLALRGIDLEHLDMLNDLIGLNELELVDLTCEDITPITHLTNLSGLKIKEVPIKTIEPLVGLGNLHKLYIMDCPIEDIALIESLKSLEDLRLHGIDLTDVTSLYALPNLRKLSLIDCSVVDLTPISVLNTLEELEIVNCPVHDLSPIKMLRNLTELRIHDVPVSVAELREMSSGLRITLGTSLRDKVGEVMVK
jgi:Leucine-rich repeat (LRR) protein